MLLFEVEKPRSITLSPSGEWIAFIVAFEQDARRNGIWVVSTDSGFSKRLVGFGAYRWRSDGQLLLIPLDLNAQYPSLYQVDVNTGKTWRLIDPELTSLSIANNDWSISPNGHWLLYHSSEDRNLWVMELPELPDSP
jgi:tricorn protease-like protein